MPIPSLVTFFATPSSTSASCMEHMHVIGKDSIMTNFMLFDVMIYKCNKKYLLIFNSVGKVTKIQNFSHLDFNAYEL